MRFTQCAVKGCLKPPMRGNRSRYCGSHHMRLYKYGSPTGRPLKITELKPYRDYVAAGLARHEGTKAVAAVLKLTTELMNFAPRHGWTKEIEMQRQLRRLVAYGITPRDIVQRVCEWHAFTEDNPTRFRSLREENHSLARVVLQLASMGTWRPQARLLTFLGEELREACGVFALAFVRRLARDVKELNDLKRQLADFSDVEPPRANP